MMQSCASAAKLRGGGPILENGVKPWPASGDRHLGSSSETDDGLFAGFRALVLPASSLRPRPPFARVLPSRCWQDKGSWHLARGHHAPQRDEQLSRQRHDQGL